MDGVGTNMINDDINNDYLKCKICHVSDHEGQFCRCEGRNIRIAKEKRERCEQTWKRHIEKRKSWKKT